MNEPTNSPADSSHRAWHTRGYLPHFDSPDIVQHVTFRLADSLPVRFLKKLEEELRLVPAARRSLSRFQRIDDAIDAGHGCCLLRQREAGSLMRDALLHFDGVRYRMYAFVVMPNHVHTLFAPLDGWTTPRITASWKSFTGRLLSSRMPKPDGSDPMPRVWQREYWDRFIRDDEHFFTTREYIHENPVKAGLAARQEDWEFSSANREVRLRMRDRHAPAWPK